MAIPSRQRVLIPARPRHECFSDKVEQASSFLSEIGRKLEACATFGAVKPVRVFMLTSAAMVAFAANSLLCRLALRRMSIDAASFSCIRIVSGAVALLLIVKIIRSGSPRSGNWASAAALFSYVAAFSFAYNTLSAGTGALLLFAAVQLTMLLWGLFKGERLHVLQWTGFALACAGLLVLVLPGVSTPPLGGSMLMLGAGMAWGVYSLRGKSAEDPVTATAGNFFRAVPLAALLTLASLPWLRIDRTGVTCAVISGAITSGVGYVIWYAALTGLTATKAATVQLSAPVVATLGGILFLGESLTMRFVLSSVAVLGGITLVVTKRPVSSRRQP